MKAKRKGSITLRWMMNSLGIIVIILITMVVTLSFVAKGYVYNGIQQALRGRSDELTNVFSNSTYWTPSDFTTNARCYVETFPAKGNMEVMAINTVGHVVIASTGFAPVSSEPMPDYVNALKSNDGYGIWTGHLKSGEKVMAITRVLHNNVGVPLGGIRYVVSMEKADKQIFNMVVALTVAGLLVIVFVTLSGIYFIRSIVRPIRKIGNTSQRIAQGDFNARIEKENDDEIGDLCDAINDMAVELGATEKMKNDFISSVSHELRTPLTAIKGWAETMQGGDMDTETMDKGMSVIIRESERLSGIVEELLDFSRMQSGRMTLMMDKIDILAELGEAVYMFSERAAAEHKYLIYDEPALLSPVLGDINRLRQVFVNIIDNALKYTAEGGTVRITAHEQEGFIYIVISDNGCGIPSGHLPNVKKKFYKANQTVRGSGIGLALADEIMTLHSGRLDIQSEENVGTVVTITIPTLREIQREEVKDSSLKTEQEHGG